jgi:hypothetical protein
LELGVEVGRVVDGVDGERAALRRRERRVDRFEIDLHLRLGLVSVGLPRHKEGDRARAQDRDGRHDPPPAAQRGQKLAHALAVPAPRFRLRVVVDGTRWRSRLRHEKLYVAAADQFVLIHRRTPFSGVVSFY